MKYLTCVILTLLGTAIAEQPIGFVQQPGALEIRIGERPFARYVFTDASIQRPYFCDVHAPNGIQVTRRNPPVEGEDPTDHAELHPGLWLAFGDINGYDFWRNKGRVEHMEFVSAPKADGHRGTFAVKNRFASPDGEEVCVENAQYVILAKEHGVFIRVTSKIGSDAHEVVFGDQEEMGLGVRMATHLTVKQGDGVILNSDGLRNEAGVWGKTAAWCSYGGTVDGAPLGVCLIPRADNFRKCWFHARDYGLLVANPFGANAFTGGEKSALRVKRGESLTLRFGVWVYSGGTAPDPQDIDSCIAELAR